MGTLGRLLRIVAVGSAAGVATGVAVLLAGPASAASADGASASGDSLAAAVAVATVRGADDAKSHAHFD
ncbi:hypothetical protein AB0J86_17415 [Micromonospora sp. NPDC049559]|uniref:hypothetical protein n=1 Tax=Micromonospora sp. NPDC049559 TaxID=3155923 RepID=UPI00343172BE